MNYLFITHLGNKGYIGVRTGNVKFKKFKEDISKFISLFDVSMNCSKEEKMELKYHNLFRAGRNDITHLLLYFIFIKFLSDSFDKFLKPEKNFSVRIPFNNDPQICINKLCNYHGETVISKYKKTYYQEYVKGEFMCPYCSCTYTMKWIWNENGDSGIQNVPYLVDRGELWNSIIIHYYELGYSLKEIANLVFLSTTTIQDYLKVYYNNQVESFYERSGKGVLEKNSNRAREEIFTGIAEVAVSNHEDMLKARKKNLLRIIKEAPKNTNRFDIYLKAQTDYIWLLRNDKEWLEKIIVKYIKK